MAHDIAVVHLVSGLVMDLPMSTTTFDLPANYRRGEGSPAHATLEFSRALSERGANEEFLIESGGSSVDGRGEMVPTMREPLGGA